MTPATYIAFKDELEKISFVMTKEKRKELPKSDFAQPKKKAEGMKGKYPMPDEQHARSALGFAKMHGDTAAYAAVRAKAMKKFPNMALKEKKSMRMPTAGELGQDLVGLGKRAIKPAAVGGAAYLGARAGSKAKTKESAALNVPQMLAQEGKGLKRGWDAARMQKSTMRLVNRGAGERQAYYAGNKAKNVAEATNVARFRGPAAQAAPVNNTAAHAQTYVRPKPGPPTGGKPSMLSRFGKPIAGLGAAALGGAGLEHHHDQQQMQGA
jgi:hypothetical protein